jgi:hypothetical protein
MNISDKTCLQNSIQRHLQTLDASLDLLPIETSLIAYELILMVMLHFSLEKDLPLKIIFANKNFTEMGARYHLTRLIKNGWLKSERSSDDLRVKVTKPTSKLISTFEIFLKRSSLQLSE